MKFEDATTEGTEQGDIRATAVAPTAPERHPNDVDRKRIERALRLRQRYRYVSPLVRPEPGGYRIESPCCSRSVDKDGGVIDIARLEYMVERYAWRLYRKDHVRAVWTAEGDYLTLTAALRRLNEDSDRVFWR